MENHSRERKEHLEQTDESRASELVYKYKLNLKISKRKGIVKFRVEIKKSIDRSRSIEKINKINF